MKEEELREIATCIMCGKPFGHTQKMFFWRLTIERYAVNINAVQRKTGLEMLLGNPYLATVMGPNEDMASIIGEPDKVTICEDCGMKPINLFDILEKLDESGAA